MIQPSDLSIVIPSRERPAMAANLLRTMLPTATVLVADQEADTYLAAGIPSAQLQTHPNLHGLARIQNWIVQHSQTLVTVQTHDDLLSIWCMTGSRPRVMKDPAFILAVFHRTAVIAQEAGAMAFGYSDYIRPLFYRANRPFLFTMSLQQTIGTIGTDVIWDERLPSDGGDIDCTLRELLLRRIVWIDTRFAPQYLPMFTTKGGLQSVRTKKHREDAIHLIQEKWGDVVDMRTRSNDKNKNTSVNRIKVKR